MAIDEKNLKITCSLFSLYKIKTRHRKSAIAIVMRQQTDKVQFSKY